MKFWVCFIFGLVSTLVFSQTVVEIPLRANFKPEPIKKNNIQSLVVFLDVYGEAIDGMQRNGKILAFEFDSTGNMSYRLSADRAKQNSFLNYIGNFRIEYFQFDDRGELCYLHRENDDEIYQLSRKYDDQGNLLQSTALSEDTVVSNHQFKWENGKMIEYTDLLKTDGSDHANY